MIDEQTEPLFDVDDRAMIASVAMDDPTPRVVIVSNGQARCVEMPDHGQLIVKTCDGKVSMFEATEKHKMP